MVGCDLSTLLHVDTFKKFVEVMGVRMSNFIKIGKLASESIDNKHKKQIIHIDLLVIPMEISWSTWIIIAQI